MQCSLIKIINTKQFLSIQLRYLSSRDPPSNAIFYNKFTKILTKQCGLVMSSWALEYIEIVWYLLFLIKLHCICLI